MVIKYQKSSICEKYFVMTMDIVHINYDNTNEISTTTEEILDLNRAFWYLGLYSDDFIKKMKVFNAIEYKDVKCEELIYLNYVLFPTEEDIKNAIDYLNSLVIMDRLRDTH